VTPEDDQEQDDSKRDVAHKSSQPNLALPVIQYVESISALASLAESVESDTRADIERVLDKLAAQAGEDTADSISKFKTDFLEEMEGFASKSDGLPSSKAMRNWAIIFATRIHGRVAPSELVLRAGSHRPAPTCERVDK